MMFVRLTDATTEAPILVALSAVTRLRERTGDAPGARVLLSCGVEFAVRESPNAIAEAISRGTIALAGAAGAAGASAAMGVPVDHE